MEPKWNSRSFHNNFLIFVLEVKFESYNFLYWKSEQKHKKNFCTTTCQYYCIWGCYELAKKVEAVMLFISDLWQIRDNSMKDLKEGFSGLNGIVFTEFFLLYFSHFSAEHRRTKKGWKKGKNYYILSHHHYTAHQKNESFV